MIQTWMYHSGTISNIVSKSKPAIASFPLLGILITDPKRYVGTLQAGGPSKPQSHLSRWREKKWS